MPLCISAVRICFTISLIKLMRVYIDNVAIGSYTAIYDVSLQIFTAEFELAEAQILVI